jgi:hypothetical protein
MSPLSRYLRLAVAALLVALSAGCVEFEKQTVYFTFPKDRDEVHALVVYEGIRVDNDSNMALKEAKKQLSDFTDEKHAVFLGWPFVLDLTPQQTDTAGEKQFKELVGKHVTIKNGAFYTRADGKLCGYQTLTVRDASKLVAGVNGMISEAMASGKPADSVDEASLDLLRRAARDKHAWVKLEPGRLSADVPMSSEMAKRTRQGALGVDAFADILKALDTPAPPRQQLEQLKSTLSFWADNPWSFDQRRDRVVVSLGVGDGEPIRLDCPPNTPREATKFDAALADHAKTLPVKFREGVTVDSLIEEFAKQHAGAKRAEK